MSKIKLVLPSQEILQKLLDYNSKTGLLYWQYRNIEYFKDYKFPEKFQKAWNNRFANNLALNGVDVSTGYKKGTIMCVKYLTHRVIYKYYYGYDPLIVDHDNRDRSDNRIINLISNTQGYNCRNSSLNKHNTSEYNGVSLNNRKTRYRARIRGNGKEVHLGTFKTKEEAIAARQEANIKYSYHVNHGKII